MQLYKAARFTAGGFKHYELYFPDGSCPSLEIVDRFLEIAEREAGMPQHHLQHRLRKFSGLISSPAQAADILSWPCILNPASVQARRHDGNVFTVVWV